MNFLRSLPVRGLILLACLLPWSPPAPGQAAAGNPSARRVSAYVVLEGDPVTPLAAGAPTRELLSGRAPSARERGAQLQARQAALEPRLQAVGARVTGRFTRVANALRVQVSEDQLAALEALPGVRRVQRARLYSRQLGVAVPFIGAPSVWSGLGTGAGAGIDGHGLRLGIIDSGIDYNHADFGGSGKVADFSANDPTRIEPGSFPTAKVVGGFDFAGDDYAPGDDAHDIPHPDPDPRDCVDGHGSHVAGIAAGFGVLTNGTTYTGEYTRDLDMSRFLVAPGVAPRAQLYALKVFGCNGSSDLVTDALEWAADPNGDYDFSDHLDVVNLSLGGAFGTLDPEDTDLAAANHLAELGCVVVCSAGNNGDAFYAVGAPGVASRALSVANSIAKGTGQALEVLGPASIAGKYYFVEGAITPSLTNTGPVGGKLVYVRPNLACDTLANAAELKGNIALIDRGTCFFSDKILHAQQAGALAVVMVNNQDAAPTEMGGDGAGITIPAGMISKADGALLKAKLAETVTVVLDARNSVERPEFIDTLDDSSSRGPGSPASRLKPEISAPGANIISAQGGSGTLGVAKTGTSMASPAVAGAATLLRQLHPDWSVEDIKAVLMNTSKPITDNLGTPYPESRMGAGRIQLAEAATALVTAAADIDTGDVGVSFGTLVLARPYQESRTVRLRNHGDQAATYRVDFTNSVEQTGIEFRVAPDTITVPARGTVTVTIELRADPTGFDLQPDGTSSPTQGAGTLLPRQFLYEASGELWFTAGNSRLHVPCYANARAATDYGVTNTLVTLPASASTKAEPVITLDFHGGSVSTNLLPLVSVFELGETSPDKHLSDPNRAVADLLAVGAATDIASAGSVEDSTVFFGLATARAWTTPQTVIAEFDVFIDVNHDGYEDFIVYNGNGSSTNSSGALDAFMPVILELDSGFRIVSTNTYTFLNYYAADELDTAVFANSVMVLPVPAGAIGLADSASSFRYKIQSYGPSGSVDRTGWIPFDAGHPVIDTAYSSPDGTPIHDDGLPISVRLDREAAHRDGRRMPGLLLLHHHGVATRRSEVVMLDLVHDDTDQDGLPDWWEQRYFGNLTTAGRNTDSDGDGVPDRDELVSGTNPSDPKSAFKMISATRVSSRSIAVRWSGVAGQTYTLERSSDLGGGFTETIREHVEATPPINSITDTTASGAGPFFYRVLLEQ